MKRLLLLSTLLLAFCFHAQAWDVGANRENRGKQTNWRWRIYTQNWGTTNPWGASQILYVYDAGGGRSLYGNVDLAWDLWDTRTHNLDTGEWAYFWRGQPYTVLGDGLFKDTGITGVANMNFTYSSSMIVGGAFTPINIQIIGNECFRNSSIQGAPINYTPNSVISVGAYAFAQCRGLSGDLVTPANVPVINDGTYVDCTGLTGTLWVTDGVTNIGTSAFARCSNMRNGLHLSNTLRVIGSNAFDGCSKLTGSIIIPNTVNAMGEAIFAHCTGFNGGLSLSTSMTYVPSWTFYDCHSLTGSIVLPASVQAVGHYAFQNCWGFNGGLGIYGNCTSIGNFAFENCPRLTGNLDIHTVTSLGIAAFQGCSGFNGVLILSNSLDAIPEAAFNGCSRLTGNLHIPSAHRIDKNAFYNCSGFNGTLSLPNNCTVIGSYAFNNCSNLTGNLYIPDNVTSLGEGAFNGGRKFNGQLHIPAHITDIPAVCFTDCNSLIGTPVIPASVIKIGHHAFTRDIMFSGELVIPANVQTLEEGAFSECYRLDGVRFAPGSNLTTVAHHIWWDDISLKYIDMTGVTKPLNNSGTISRTANSVFYRTRPYTIVYLPNSTNPGLIPADQENFVVDGNCANFKVYDTHADYKGNRGCDYEIKHQFTAAKANYTRTFSGKDAATLFLPYPTTLPAGMTAYELKNMKRADGKSMFVFAPLPSSATLEANKAYVVRVTDGGSHNLPEMHNVIVPVTPALASTATLGTADNNWQFNGTTQFIPNATAASMKAYNLNVGNTWLPVTTANINGHIHSFRAFLTSPTGTAPAKSFVMLLDDGPVITNIDSIRKGEADVQSGRYPFYSLDGRNLGRDYNRLPSGNIYIVNGKKFYKN